MTQIVEISRTTTAVIRDGERIGRVINTGRTFCAVRRTGEAGVDIRRVSQGFRKIENAVAWIERSS
jgi:hypothetical protein